MCVKYRHLFINIKVWKYSLYSREKIWVGEFPNCLVGRQSAFWAMVGSSSLLQGNKNLVHHILSPSLSFPLWLFFPSSLSTIASCLLLAPPLHIMNECERGLSAGREETLVWGHSLGTLHFQGKQEPRKGNTQGDTDKGAEMFGMLG